MSQRFEQSTFLAGANGVFIEELYARYAKDPASVDPSWRAFFAELKDDAPSIERELAGASWAPRASHVIGNGGVTPTLPTPAPPTNGNGAGLDLRASEVRAATLDSVRALMLIRAYRIRGHLAANLDPLGMNKREAHAELDPATYGFSEADFDREIFIDHVLGLETATLSTIQAILKETYCGNIGVEFAHIQDPDQKSWIQRLIEGERNQTRFTRRGKLRILERLTAAEEFEKYLHVKYTATKRFGLDGAESLIPALEQVVRSAACLGIKEIVIGMPHRGRLNVLTNLMGKSYAAVFSEFQGNAANPEDVQGSGDVKYHLGTSTDRDINGNIVHLSLSPNPSHLEAVDPVVVGKVRAKQTQRGDEAREQVMSVLMHGDAAFAGQGLVAETFAFSGLRGYRTGGTIHVIVNNQIGFTTAPAYSRFTPYPSDVAHMVQAPVFHVNGDDPEAVVHVARVATEFRQRFKRDVVIDLICYRRFGHNEADEPAFTQPLMVRAIADQPTTRQVYAQRLEDEGAVESGEPERVRAQIHKILEEGFETAKTYKPNKADWLEGRWAGFEVASGEERRGDTDVSLERLREVGAGISRPPENFSVNRKLLRVMDQRRQTIESGEGIDWGTAEALAFGTLLREGIPVRLSGQDSGRGTFSHRHAILVDQETEERYFSLSELSPDQAKFEVMDSPLSEASVLGFEYGYSQAEPNSLVIWEAQFGDFANGAQVIIDQFIAPGESKWLRMSGLVLLLPHGYEGQGPEHSSARLERYLQLSGEDNWQVVNLTTPANYFHALRRQVHRNFRKPLVVMAPKSLLRHKLAVSRIEDIGPGSCFNRVLLESGEMVDDAGIKRVVLCSGKVYYDLLAERTQRGIDDVALVRIEQLYPFPFRTMEKALGRYGNAEFVWCQEEPRNMGAWNFIDRRIETVLSRLDIAAKRPIYVGRDEAASPATGLLRRHLDQQAKLVDQALSRN